MDFTSASTSRVSGAPPEVLDEIQKLFNWKPPYLKVAKKSLTATGKIKETGTRTYSFYDRHFKEEIILKRVERFPNLLTQLVENVDQIFTASTMPSNLLGFITDDLRVEDRRTMGKTMSDESEVADYYKNTTARYCTRVASTLAFHPSRWQSSLLKWTKSGPFSDYAIPDGVLLFVANEGDLDEEDRELNLKEMDPETRRIFDAMREKKDSLAS